MNAVITGASRGIGLALAKVFAASGYNLCVTARNEETLVQAVAALSAEFPNITIKAKAADLGDKEQAITFGKWVVDTVDSIDVLINNAGTFTPGNISDEGDGALEQMLSVNLYSAYHLTRAVLPKMKRAKTGHIFTICSIAGLTSYPGGGAYSISKFALVGFTKNLRHELKEWGIKVTAVVPGAVYTDSWIGSGISKERIMEAGDIAAMIYAASQLSPQATVEEIVLRPQLGDL